MTPLNMKKYENCGKTCDFFFEQLVVWGRFCRKSLVLIEKSKSLSKKYQPAFLFMQIGALGGVLWPNYIFLCWKICIFELFWKMLNICWKSVENMLEICWKYVENRPEINFKRPPPLKYTTWAPQEDLAGAFFYIWCFFCLFSFSEKYNCLEDAKNKLKSKKMRTDESFPVVQTNLKKDQSLRGKHRK